MRKVKEDFIWWSVLGIIFIGLLYCYHNSWLTLNESATIFALIAGPVVAVIITRYHDESKRKKERQLMTLRDLMKSRVDLIPTPAKEYIEAFNLIPIDFVGQKRVIVAWKELFEALHPVTRPDPADSGQHFFKLQCLTAELISTMGESLGIIIQPLDIMQKAYIPTGWQEERVRKDSILRRVESLLAAVLFSQAENPDVKSFTNGHKLSVLNMLYLWLNTLVKPSDSNQAE